MNFDADRLSRLSGLSTTVNTGVIAESVELEDTEVVAEGEADELEDDAPLFELEDDLAEGHDVITAAGHEQHADSATEPFELFNPVTALGHWRDKLFGKVDKDPGDSTESSDLQQRRDGIAILLGFDDYDDAGRFSGIIDRLIVDADEEEAVEESASLTMETLRETVLELRDEILAENEAEQQALTEAPARAAIRKEIKALLAEMPTDASANWMYGSKGKPSQNGEKSRATTLLGIGFENSKN